tara:strand:+ start:1248 stop:2132 length:885 start_codon:yes stop_codon:yes gene_type:complete
MGLFLGATELSTGGGGGGGFTKINKYSTNRALGGNTVIIFSNSGGPPSGVTFEFRAQSAISAGATSFTTHQLKFDNADIPNGTAVPANAYKGFKTTFAGQGGVATDVTILTSAAFTAAGNGSATSVMTFTPALTQNMDVLSGLTFTPILTVNPATDLGLADGASIGYLMVSGGSSTNDNSAGGNGGAILQGTAIITTASTDLLLTPGIGGTINTSSAGTQSTITGGLTLTTADGNNNPGNGASGAASAQPGILGYGQGGKAQSYSGTGAIGGHGFGNGSPRATQPGDGAILLYY